MKLLAYSFVCLICTTLALDPLLPTAFLPIVLLVSFFTPSIYVLSKIYDDVMAKQPASKTPPTQI